MAEDFRLVIAVLAAGSSRRFGDEDKLAADLKGKPLGCYATRGLAGVEACRRVVIAAAPDHPCNTAWSNDGFDVQINPDAAKGMGTSVAMATKIAKEKSADALLIALADMPLVPIAHFENLAKLAQDRPSAEVICSEASGARSPPAVFARSCFDQLIRLKADIGARALLASAQTVLCPAEWLLDVDDKATFARLNALV